MSKRKSRPNPILVKEARSGLNKMRYEIANELGIENAENWSSIDPGQKVIVGREMSKKLVERGMEILMKQYGQGD